MTAYVNPVHSRSCPDPYVLKFCGKYWCYCTGWWRDGRCFGVLASRDLVHWIELDGAMDPLDGGFKEYWAPEVIYLNGSFYMYYSVGDGVTMHIRVAVADQPAGPFHDSGERLTTQDFAIDAHCFQDEDGSLYMFYATDFLDRSHIGTGTVVDRMIDPFTLAGEPRPVALARFDWQVFDPKRIEKGGARWHTIEGPFVMKRKGLYYEMFSGGNWKDTSYGVSYASTADIAGPTEWKQIEHDERTPLILRTLPDKVIGPGHNSVVLGPDNRQLFCIYHRWSVDVSARLLAIDRLEWIGERLAVFGPSTAPQPVPNPPTISGFDAVDGLPWVLSKGRWRRDGASALCESGSSEARLSLPVAAFLAQVYMRSGPVIADASNYGLRLAQGSTEIFSLTLAPFSQHAIISRMETEAEAKANVDLPPDFEHKVFHLVQVQVDGLRATLALDGIQCWQGRLGMAPGQLHLFANGCVAGFSGFELTLGWQDLFLETGLHPGDIGWQVQAPEGSAEWIISDRQLKCHSARFSMLAKEHALADYEVVINSRLVGFITPDAQYGFCPVLCRDGTGPLFSIETPANGPVLALRELRGPDTTAPAIASFPLGDRFDPLDFQQFRFRKQNTRLVVQLESQVLTEIQVPATSGRVALFVRSGAAAFDMVRVTATRDQIRAPELTSKVHNG